MNDSLWRTLNEAADFASGGTPSKANPASWSGTIPWIRELGDPVLKTFDQALTQKLRGSATVDWHKRDSVRARLRNLVRITPRRHRYPPDMQEEAIRLVLQQAERLADDWA